LYDLLQYTGVTDAELQQKIAVNISASVLTILGSKSDLTVPLAKTAAPKADDASDTMEMLTRLGEILKIINDRFLGNIPTLDALANAVPADASGPVPLANGKWIDPATTTDTKTKKGPIEWNSTKDLTPALVQKLTPTSVADRTVLLSAAVLVVDFCRFFDAFIDDYYCNYLYYILPADKYPDQDAKLMALATARSNITTAISSARDLFGSTAKLIYPQARINALLNIAQFLKDPFGDQNLTTNITVRTLIARRRRRCLHLCFVL
jgi:hypothetical protein